MTRRDASKKDGAGASLQRFWKNRSGAFAMQFALLVAPLVICTGLAIDGGRSFLARYELESALDAAALAVGSTVGSDDALNALARKYVDTNFKAPDTTQVVLDLHPTNDKVTLSGTTQLSTYFMPLIGMPKVTIAASTEVRRGGSNVEVGLMLDITGSMGSKTDPNSRISTLITAANSMIDTVVNDTQTPWFSKIAIVPWANNVNVGTWADALRGAAPGTAITNATWKQDVETISNVTWRNGSALTVSAATWKNGNSKTASKIQESSSKTTVTSNNHGFGNGDYIYLTGAGGGFTSLNNTIFKVASASSNSFNLQTVGGADINLTGTPSNSTTGTLQKCFNSSCQFQITTSGNHGLSIGDTVYLSSIMTGIDSTATSSSTTAITIAALGAASPSTTFMVPGSSPSITGTYSGSAGRVQKCFTATCQFQVQTSGSHTFTTGDHVYIMNATWSPSSGAPAINGTTSPSFSLVTVPTTIANAFLLPTFIGPYYTNTYTANSGTANTCFSATCEIQVTAPSHGIGSSDKAFITGVGGFTGATPAINNVVTSSGVTATFTTPTSVTANTFLISGAIGPKYSAGWTSGTGTVWCLKTGCQYYRYPANDGSNPIRQISNCVTERVGTDAATDAAPGTSPLGDDYPIIGDDYNDCTGGVGTPPATTNLIVPLTANKATLHATINALTVTGSTAGHIGVGWGWYMVSPNFASVWTPPENKPLAYGTPHLTKVMVLMTDGDFNTGHCNGVASKDYQVNLGNNQKINCNTTGGAPYTQATNLCTAMRADPYKVIIYTVGFQVTANSAADNFLRGCATDVGHYYLASNNAELSQAFASIATNISQLRISR